MKKIFSVLLLFLPVLTIAQTEMTDSLKYNLIRPDGNILFSRFEKQLNTYNLNSQFGLKKTFGKFSINIYENFISTFIKTTPKNIKDEQYDTIGVEYAFFPSVSLGGVINNNILSDDRKIGLNQASITSSYIYSRISPSRQFSFRPFFGYSGNRQIGEKDDGFIYGADMQANNFEFTDMDFNATGKFNNEDISPRKNTLRLLNLNLSNFIENKFINVLSASFQQSRKDFYFHADTLTASDFKITNNIQSRIESNYFLQNRFMLNTASPFNFDLMGRIIWRKIERQTRFRSLKDVSTSVFDVDVNEFRLEFESNASLRLEDFNANIRLGFSERDEKHLARNFEESNIFFQEERKNAFEERQRLESQKNNIADRISLLFSGNYLFTQSDILYFSLIHNKLIYDTPSDENFDDRDELLSIMRLNYIRVINPFFNAFINLEGSFNHVVYLFSERSSNNNIRRILKLGTGGNYHGMNFYSHNLFEVSANYTTYDFEDVNPNYRSYSFRQLSMQDSTNFRLMRNIYIDFYGYMRISEQGDFKWSSFSGKPTRDLEEIYLEPKIVLKRNQSSFGIGIRYLALTTFMYRPDRQRETEYKSIGPLTEIIISIYQRLLCRINGWYEFIQMGEGKTRELANLNIQVAWEF